MSDTLDNRFHFDRAHVEDLPAISSLAAGTVLGSHRAVPLDVKKAWMRKNPEVLHVLRRGDEIVGYVCMLPLSKETVMQALQGKISARAIPLDEIEPFTPSTSLALYIVEAVVKQDMPDKVRVAARFISEIAKFVIHLTQQNMLVEELYAVAVTPSGIRLCRALDFQEMHLPGAVEAGRIPFQLEVKAGQSLAVARWVSQFDVP
jgi:hypothetical protein